LLGFADLELIFFNPQYSVLEGKKPNYTKQGIIIIIIMHEKINVTFNLR